MKLRIVCAGFLLALCTACGSSVTAPSDPPRDVVAAPGQPVMDEEPEGEDGGGTMGSGH